MSFIPYGDGYIVVNDESYQDPSLLYESPGFGVSDRKVALVVGIATIAIMAGYWWWSKYKRT